MKRRKLVVGLGAAASMAACRAGADAASGTRQAQHRNHRRAGDARREDVKEHILKCGFLPLPNRGLDELKDFVKSEIVRWGKVVHEAGIAGSQ